jgi:N-acetylated-alpha-linked acidic dipeptidase
MIAIIFLFKEDRKFRKIRDIFGIIKGHEEPDRYVILGNHRDAWTYGAVDPNSGTAALLDIARRLGIMLQSGWKPQRSIILCSWDAEEFGMVSRHGRKMIRCYCMNMRFNCKRTKRCS